MWNGLVSYPRVAAKNQEGPGQVPQLVGALLRAPKYRVLYSWSGYIPRLLIPSPVGVRARGNQPVFLLNINVSLPSSLPFCVKSISISSGEDLKNWERDLSCGVIL